MAHDPCINCGSYPDSTGIKLSGEAPKVTLCSYKCLEEFAKSKQDE